jgi:glutamate dehydrogenase
MLPSTEDQKHAVVEQAAGLASAHAAAMSGDARAIRHFVEAFYQHVSPDDVVARAPSDLSDAALSLWRFAAEREAGRPKIRVLSPSAAEETWLDGHSVVQIVNDDMPFLVDSITAALTGLGLEVQLVIHPVLSVQRDATGHLVDCGAEIASGINESLMHIELAGDADAPSVGKQLPPGWRRCWSTSARWSLTCPRWASLSNRSPAKRSVSNNQ